MEWVEAKCSGKNLAEKIEALAGMGWLSRAEAKMLHALRFMGNAAAHEIAEPDFEELTDALNIVEHLLLTIFYYSDAADRLIRAHERRERANAARAAKKTAAKG